MLILLLLMSLLLPLAGAGAASDTGKDADDENGAVAPPGPAGALALSHSQQQAVGIRVDHPVPMASAAQIEAYGLVLDPVALLADAGRMDSTQAAADAAAADVARLDSLYHNNADASLKALQASRSLAIEASAQARTAAATFRLDWGPLAALSATSRRELIDALCAGRQLLVRADVPGQQWIRGIGARALVIVDGVGVAARVLGALPRTDPQSLRGGWLLQIERAPEGLGPGARAGVRLQTAPVGGVLVPTAALLYDERGAYVYREISGGGEDKSHYAAAPVRLLVRAGDGWLVGGLDRSDSIVVQGAGFLWSLEGLSAFPAAQEEHD
jgi:hypothetical protein